jgi:hypothetical protein
MARKAYEKLMARKRAAVEVLATDAETNTKP